MGIAEAIMLVNALNAASPGIAQLILMIKNKDGSVSIVAMLDEAEAKFKDNMKVVSDWLKEHPQ